MERDYITQDRPAVMSLDMHQLTVIVTSVMRKEFQREFERMLELLVNPYCDMEESCNILKCGKTTLHNLINAGKFKKYYKSGSNIRLKREDLYKYIESTKQQ